MKTNPFQFGRFLSLLSPLDRKLARDLLRIRGQAVAIALVVACGVAVFVMMLGAVRSLELTRDAYYDRYRFADVFFSAKRAPEHIAQWAGQLPGVVATDARIHGRILAHVEGFDAPITGEVISVEAGKRPRLIDLYLTTGRWLASDTGDEAIVLEDFARAHGLVPGDELLVTMHGHRQKVRIVGLALSPEFVAAVPPGEVAPLEERFAVIWMGRKTLASVYDLDGAFNQLLIRLDVPSLRKEAVQRIEQRLERYGGAAAMWRADQRSNRFLRNELDQLAILVKIVPSIFLIVAAFLLNIAIARIVDGEREQIGLLKAFGISHWAVGWHYAKFSFVIVIAGVLIGWGVGSWMGRGLANLYTTFFDFPLLLFRPGPMPYAASLLVGLFAASLGAMAAVRKSVALQPAEAMRPPAPTFYAAGLLTNVGWFSRKLDQPMRLALRHIWRWPGRSAVTCFGIALAMAIRVASQQTWDSVDHMLTVSYEIQARHDVSVAFVEPQSPDVAFALASEPGVLMVEPFRTVAARLRYGNRERNEGVIGVPYDAELNRLLDGEEVPVEPPPVGVVISKPLSRELGVAVGDVLTVEATEGRRPTVEVPVSRISQAYIGAPAYMAFAELNRVMEEGPRVSGAYLLLDQDKRSAVISRLMDMPQVAAVSEVGASRRALQATMDEFLGTMTIFNTLFSSLIAIGVVYNAARMTLSERSRELASLRVLGFGKGEVAFVLLFELAVLTLLALPVGAAMGYGLAAFISYAMSTDLFSMPLNISHATWGIAASTIGGAAVVSGLWVARLVARLDLISALKTRE